MRVLTHNDYLLLERFTPEQKSEFIIEGDPSPLFRVINGDTQWFIEDGKKVTGKLVMPRQGAVIPTKLEDKEYFWVKVTDIMGEVEL